MDCSSGTLEESAKISLLLINQIYSEPTAAPTEINCIHFNKPRFIRIWPLFFPDKFCISFVSLSKAAFTAILKNPDSFLQIS